MFGKFMNNYYYGKSGKGDYRPEDLPRTRMQLFWEMLRVRLSGLCRLNLMYVLVMLPMLLVISNCFVKVVETLNMPEQMQVLQQEFDKAISTGTGLNADGSITITANDGSTVNYNVEAQAAVAEFLALDDGEVARMQVERFRSELMWCLILLIPAIAITGPMTAGVAFVTRNWARDEHAFIWSDCKDAIKANWKGALVISAITSVVPLLAYLCWTFYGSLANDSMLMLIPQIITLMVAMMWCLTVTYTYPMLVTYKMSLGTVLRNSLLLAIGRLPLSVGVRLLHCVPVALATLIFMMTGSLIVPLILFAYYVLFGFAGSRFVTASYTNAQFDRYINARIEGAQVNRGLNTDTDDDDDDEDDEEEERPLRPWENGYTSQD